MDTPVRPAQGALGVRSTLHLGVAVAADCVRAVPPVRRRTRVRIPRWPRRAELMHTHRAILACPQRVGRRSGHPSVGKALGSRHRAEDDKRSGSLAKGMEAVLVEAGYQHMLTVSPRGVGVDG